MREHGGFEHNLQSLRTVDELEERYALFPGLNLTYECREGILKHCAASKAKDLGDVGQRFLLRQQPGLEAQLANLADEIAYNNHDVDDGIRAGLITLEQAAQVPLVQRHFEQVMSLYPDLQGRRRVHETVRRIVNEVVIDVIQSSAERLLQADPLDIDAVRVQSQPLIGMSEAMRAQHLELKHFLREQVYRHQRVLRMTTKARRVVRELYGVFMEDIKLMPAEYRDNAQRAQEHDGLSGRARIVADYIAGMTDRYAIVEYSRLFDPSERT
jgi:dGTPase